MEEPTDDKSVSGYPLKEVSLAVPDLMRNSCVAGRENFDLFFAHSAWNSQVWVKFHPHYVRLQNHIHLFPINWTPCPWLKTFLAPSITRRGVRALVHIRFPIAHNLCFVVKALTIREHMGLATVEKNGSMVRVLSSMITTLSFSRIPSIGSVQRMVWIIRKVEDIENALESIAPGINKRHWRSHLSGAFLIQHQLEWPGKFRNRTLIQPLEDICGRFKGGVDSPTRGLHSLP